MLVNKFPFFIKENFDINIQFYQHINNILSYDDPNNKIIVKFKYNRGEIDLTVYGTSLTNKIAKYQTRKERLNALLKPAENVYNQIKPRLEFLRSYKNRGDYY